MASDSDSLRHSNSSSAVTAGGDGPRNDHRRQRTILFGGGAIVTIVLLLVALAVIQSMARDYIGERYAEFSVRAALLQLDFATREGILRIENQHQEATWPEREPASAAMQEAFGNEHGQLTLRGNNRFDPVQVIGDLTGAPPAAGYARYLALAQEFSYRLGAYSTSQGALLGGYFYSPDGGFVGITLSPEKPLLHRSDGSVDTHALVRAISTGLDTGASATKSDDGMNRRTIWLPPFTDPLTGRIAVRAIQICYADGKPFLVIVTEMPVYALRAKFGEVDRPDEFAAIVGRDGFPILNTDDSEAGRQRLSNMVRAPLPSLRGQLPSLAFWQGRAVFRAMLPGAEWTVYRSISWRTMLSDIGTRLGLVAAGLLLALSVVWAVLILLNQRVLRPGYERARRVFESENLNRTMVVTAPTGLALLDLKTGEILQDNAVAREIADQVPSGSPTLPERLLACYRQAPTPDAWQADLELSLDLADGETCELLLSAIRSTYRDADVLLCNFVDITRRKQLEHHLAEAKQAADAANRAKSTFLATMSHEIRTPLNAILGSLELLGRTTLDDSQHKRLNTAVSSGTALLAIINDVLDLSKVESGQMSFERVSFDLAGLSRGIAAMFEPLAHAKHLEFSCEIDPMLAHRYLGDPTRLRQIVVNLVGNAIKFTDEGEVVLEVYLENEEDQTRIAIGVIDSGIGMTAEQQRGIFSAFTQADSSITRRFGGTGLGLSLCRQLVDLMGGEIECTSERGVGSTFIVRLKLPVDTNPAEIADSVSVADSADAPIDLKLLVVDDHPVNRDLLHDQLAVLGYDSDVAGGGTDALRLLSQNSYDLVLTDLNMPRMDGYALARFIRDRYAEMPIIAITAHATDHERALCRQVEIDDVLVKPSTLEAIDTMIRFWVKRANLPQRPAGARVDPSRGVLSAEYGNGLRTTLKRSVSQIKDALERQDATQVAAELHFIKGAFAMIHEAEVVARCAQMEVLAKNGDMQSIAASLDVLEAMAVDALASRMSESGKQV
jgi:two-component system, NarL family, capsular synthesis sensor histidine kinase RcsC